MMLVAMVDVSLGRDDGRSSASLGKKPRIDHKQGPPHTCITVTNGTMRTCAYVHPVRGMGYGASGRLLASGATCDGGLPNC